MFHYKGTKKLIPSKTWKKLLKKQVATINVSEFLFCTVMIGRQTLNTALIKFEH